MVTFDARNHGRSLHASPMSYQAMADDLAGLLSSDLGADRASLLGHSMGGRAAMLLALQRPEVVEKLFVVDISPINYGKVSFCISLPEFKLADFGFKVFFQSSDYSSMSEIFEALRKVEFPDSGSVTMSQARKDLDSQLKDLGGPLLQVRTKVIF